MAHTPNFKVGDRVTVPKDEPEHMQWNPSFCGSKGTVLGYVADRTPAMVQVDYDSHGVRITWERCLVHYQSDLEVLEDELLCAMAPLFMKEST